MTGANETAVRSREAGRIDAVDVLRGSAVLLLFASTSGARAVFALPDGPVIEVLRRQLRPSVWTGFTLADLCFPAFLFVAGMSLALSFERRKEQGGTGRQFVIRSCLRGVKLYGIGFLVMNAAAAGHYIFNGRGIAWTGPLQQLGVCIAIGGMTAVCFRRVPTRLGLCLTMLALYGLLLAWRPANASQAGPYAFMGNAAVDVDGRFLPDRKFFGVWDPHGFLTAVPACAILLFGLTAGSFLARNPQEPQRDPKRLAAGMSAAGLVCLNVSLFTAPVQPCNPHLVTPTFAFGAAGVLLFAMSGALMACSSPLRPWTSPFVALGRNSLPVVIAMAVLPLARFSDGLVSGDIATSLGGFAPLCRMLIELAAISLPAHLLSRRRRFVTL